jgi:hypothetical protein
MKRYFAILLMLLTTSAYSAEGTTGYQAPKKLHVYSSSGSIFFRHQASNCNGDSVFELLPSNSAYYVLYSMLMEAYKDQRKIAIRYTSCRSDGIRPRVEGIYFE